MKRRIFIAINLPEEIKKKLFKLLRILEKENRNKPIKWIRPESLHITLHFLGYLDEEQIRKVGEGMERVSGQYPVLQLELDGLGAFPNLNRPRVIFIKCKEVNSGSMQSIQKNLGEELEKININVDHRIWHPHITLGRIKSYGVKLRSLKHEVRSKGFTVGSVDLMESKLSRAGAQYSVIKSYKLK